MRAILASLLLLTALLAGCADGGKDKDDGATASSSTSSTSTTASSTTSSSSTTTTAPANRPPTASLAAVANGTSVRFNLTGADPDGDDLAWNLTFGDGGSANGTGLPANATHAFAAAGNYTANLTVSDGKLSATANVTVTVVAAGGPPAPVQVASLTWDVPNTGCGASYDVWEFGTPAAGLAWAELAVDASTIGKPYTATFEYTATGPLATVAMDFYDAEGLLLDGGFFEIGTTGFTGTVPAGAANALFFDCFTAGGTVVQYAA